MPNKDLRVMNIYAPNNTATVFEVETASDGRIVNAPRTVQVAKTRVKRQKTQTRSIINNIELKYVCVYV